MSAGTDHITLLSNRTYFASLFEAVGAAREELLAETYIFRFDRTGTEFVRLATEAVRRGVRVRMLVDALGSPELMGEGERRIREAGIELVVYNRTGRLPLRTLHDRMHRKLIVVDRRVAFVGGLNIADEYAGLDVPGSFYDLAARIQGPIAADAADRADELIMLARSSAVRRAWREIRRFRSTPLSSTGVMNRIVARDNHARRNTIEREYVQAIRGARRSILMAHAYFLPSHRLLKTLCAASRRGVEVRVVLQGRAEHTVLRAAQWHLYHRMLRAGVWVYEYQRHYLHAKVMTVDGRWSTIGSSNLEPWSLTSNHELNLISACPSLARDLEEEIEPRLETECTRIDPSRLGWFARLTSALAYELVLWVFVVTGGRSTRLWRTPPRSDRSRRDRSSDAAAVARRSVAVNPPDPARPRSADADDHA